MRDLLLFMTSVASIILSGVVGSLQYRDKIKIDTKATKEIQNYNNIVERVDSLEAEQKVDREWQNRHDNEQLAKMRIIIINELKRCIKQKYRTEVDIELIDPLLQIYFEKPYTGNGVIKSYEKIYQSLPFKQDALIEQSK